MVSLWQFGPDEFIRPTEPDDAMAVAANMREADQVEVWASHAMRPLEACLLSIAKTPEPLTIWKGDEPAALFGVVPVSTVVRSGIIWLLGTVVIEQNPIPFLRHTKEVMNFFLESHEHLYNWIHEDNRLSQRWLKWCGYKPGPEARGPFGDVFHKYEIKRRWRACV